MKIKVGTGADELVLHGHLSETAYYSKETFQKKVLDTITFNDTEKSSANLHSINSFSPIRIGDSWIDFQPYGSMTTNTTYTGRYRKIGHNRVACEIKIHWSGVPNSTALTITGFPFSFANKTPSAISGSTSFYSESNGRIGLSNTVGWQIKGIVTNGNTIQPQYLLAAGTHAAITQSAPVAIADNTSLHIYFEAEINMSTSSFPNNISRVYFGRSLNDNGAWIMTGISGTQKNRNVMYSPNNLDFYHAEYITETIISIARSYVTGEFMAGVSSSGADLIGSFDGVNWSLSNPAPEAGRWDLLFHTGMEWIAGSSTLGKIYSTTNPWMGWTSIKSSFIPKAIAGGSWDFNTCFIVVRGSGSGSFGALRQYNGVWEEVTISGATTNFTGIAFSRGIFVATRSNGLYISNDMGLTWEFVSGVVINNICGEYNSPYFMGTMYGSLVYSKDGKTWEFVQNAPKGSFSSIAYGNGRFMVADQYPVNDYGVAYITPPMVE